jgi:DNA adenine methylase
MLAEGLVGRLVLVEKDPDYVAVWQTVLSADAAWLADKIQRLVPHRALLRDLLGQEPTSRREQAFLTIVSSWCYHRGRRTTGCGLLPQQPSQRGGAALATAWRPQALALRIRALHDLRRHIDVMAGSGIDAIQSHAARREVFVYADPPYPTAGQRMYRYGDVDIPYLLRCCRQAQGPAVVSCEDTPDVCALAATLGFDLARVRMHSAKNIHQEEILISNRPLPSS